LNAESQRAILQVHELRKYFPVTRGLLHKETAEVKAVDGINFTMMEDETLGLVGESGCGKTTIGRCILRQYRPSGGRIVFDGEDITDLSQKKLRKVRRKMTLIFQDPYGSLNPRMNAGSIVGEPLRIHKMNATRGEYRDRIEELFRMVGLEPGMMNRFPHEFSGGQRQRIGVARALACEPSLVVCDEPVSALDVSIQAQIINLLEELKERIHGLSYLFIAHDLSVVRHVSDRVAVMYLGRVVEMTDSQTLYENPLHPYTRALLSAIPIADPFIEESRENIILEGEVPSPLNPPQGCSFHPRCFMAVPECSRLTPELREMGTDHQVACLRLDP
jgi:oligopeptide/dipeptide ABC transporter ATP-binding protein